MRNQFLQVYANPYAFIDADGNPACAVPMEASHAGNARRYVGATIDRERSQAPGVPVHRISRGPGKPPAQVDEKTPRHPVVFAFDPAAQTVPNSSYYRQQVKDGSLIAADALTARLCGVAFVDPKKRLEESKAKAAREWTALWEEPAPWESTSAPVVATGKVGR